jgi:hypothetical protein
MAPAGAPDSERASKERSNGALEAACQRRIERMSAERSKGPEKTPSGGKRPPALGALNPGAVPRYKCT